MRLLAWACRQRPWRAAGSWGSMQATVLSFLRRAQRFTLPWAVTMMRWLAAMHEATGYAAHVCVR